jgi:hypothetical protein
VKPAVGQNIHRSREQFFKILLEPDQVKEGSIRVHLDQQVQIASRTVVAAGDRAEQPHVSRTVPRRNPDDLIANAFEVHCEYLALIVDLPFN